jgi:hypothetical protein
MRRFVSLGIAAAVSLGLAACGGGDGDGGGDSSEGFTADANRVCAEGQRTLVDRYLERGIPSSPGVRYEFDKLTLSARVRLAAGLRKLDPPADRREAFESYVSLRRKVADLTANLIAASASRVGAKAARKLEAQINRTLAESLDAADAAGLDVCARKLSPSDAKAVRAVITEFEPSADPERSCRDLVTTQFLLSRFPGGYAQCAAYVKKHAGSYAKSVDVTDIEGTDGVEAIVRYKDVGGSAAGVPASATLYYVDGEWKIFSAQEEKPGG